MHKRFVSLSFLALLCGLPIAQAVRELAHDEPVQILELPEAFREDRRDQFEEDLRKSSFVAELWVPRYQQALSLLFGHGNEKAIKGRAGVFFYADDLDMIGGRGFMGPGGTGPRALEIIVEFRDALADRGIDLLVVPVPVKGMLDAQFLALPAPDEVPADAGQVPRNPDHDAFFEALDEAGIRTVRLLPALVEAARVRARDAGDGSGEEAAIFLPRDTHWRPEAMELAAREVAKQARELLGAGEPEGAGYERGVERVSGEGDLVRMLRLPDGAEVFAPMDLDVHPVRQADGSPARPDPTSDVLLLGDSFTRVFSDPELGFGQNAGFGEHLAAELGRPIDVIALLGGSATAVRDSLARRRGGLDGKRLVVWEFGLRALGEGPAAWGDVELPPPGETTAPVAPQDPGGGSSGDLVIEARLVAPSRIPEEFDYAYCLVIHEYAVERVVSGALTEESVWVAFAGMVEYELQPAESWQSGLRQRLLLADLEEHHPLEETSFVDDAGAPIDQPIYWAVEFAELD